MGNIMENINKLMSNIRYRLTYRNNEFSFGASMANTNEELITVLEEMILVLKVADSAKLVIGECDICYGFIFEDEKHNCSKL